VVTVLGGVALIVTSAVLIGNSGTKVDSVQQPPPRDAWRRVPEAHGPGWSAPAPKAGAPIFSVRF
jgi:hypothetical protein